MMSNIINRNYTDDINMKEEIINELVPKYFPDIDVNKRIIGLLGLTTELISNSTESVFHAISTLSQEVVPSKAIIPENIYDYANIFNINSVFTTPAYCKIPLIIQLSDIERLGTTYHGTSDIIELILDENIIINIEDVYFSLNYPVSIKRKSGTNNLYTANYIIDVDNLNSVVGLVNTNINTSLITKEGILVLDLYCHQFKREYTEETIIINTRINYPTYDISFNDLLAGIDITYRDDSVDKIALELVPYGNMPTKKYFCYYRQINDNTIQISFNSKDGYFQPKFNSVLSVIKYSTLGKEGEFESYDGNNVFIEKPKDGYSSLLNLSIIPALVSSSVGSVEKPTLETLRALTVEAFSSGKKINTDMDIKNYYKNFKYRYGQDLFVISRRDDIMERIHGCFTVVKNSDDYIYETNTCNIKIPMSVINNISDAEGNFSISTGSIFKYIANSNELIYVENEHISNQIIYDKYSEIIFTSRNVNFFKLNTVNNTYEYINGINLTIIKNNIPSNIIDSLIAVDILVADTTLGYTIYKESTKAFFKKKYDIENKLLGWGYNIIDDNNQVLHIASIGYLDDNTMDTLSRLDTIELSEPEDFVYVNPYLIQASTNPDLIGLYQTIMNTNVYVEEEQVLDNNSFFNFNMSYMNIDRDVNTDNSYELSFKLFKNAVSQINFDEDIFVKLDSLYNNGVYDETHNINLITDNILKVVVSLSSNSIEEGLYMAYPVVSEETDNITFKCRLLCEDMILSNKQIRMNNGIRMNSFNDKITLDGNACTVRFYILYNDSNGIPYNPNIITGSDTIGFMDALKTSSYIINKYKSATYISLFRQMRMMRNYITYENDYVNISLVPVTKFDILHDKNKLNDFISLFDESYNFLNMNDELLRQNTSLDIKYYNTYGKNMHFTIGENNTLLDSVNIKLKLDIFCKHGTDLETTKEDIKHFIRKLVVDMNRDEEYNNLYISNLLRDIENNYENVVYCKFNGINRYDTSIQSIHVKTVNIDNLTKIEKRNYVPDMLVINVNNIFLNVDTI